MEDRSIFAEEEAHLQQVEQRLDEMAQEHRSRAREMNRQIGSFRSYDREDAMEKRNLRSRQRQEVEEAEKILSWKPRPYLGRLDVEDQEDGEVLVCYLGKQAIRDGNDHLVYDWRSPLMDVFYRPAADRKFTVQVDDRPPTEYVLQLKREFLIEDARLLDLKTTYDGMEVSLRGEVIDSFLLVILKDRRRQKALTDIIQTIQDNQNRIIRLPRQQSFVCQGCAGSGKTMVLLHRLSYLKYNNRSMDLRSIRIVTPNPFFDTFVNDLSQELELTDIRRMPVERYYTSLMSRYSSSREADSEVLSEQMLNPRLMEEIYSLDYQEEFIARYHRRWEQVLGCLDTPRLLELFQRTGTAYPSMEGHSSDSLQAMKAALSSTQAGLQRRLEALEKVQEARRSREHSRAKLEEEMEEVRSSLEDRRRQLLRRVREDREECERNLQDGQVVLETMTVSLLAAQGRRTILQEELRLAQPHMDQVRQGLDLYTHWDSFQWTRDPLSQEIRREFPQLIGEIRSRVRQADRVPPRDFARRNALLVLAAEQKEEFTRAVTGWLEEKLGEAAFRYPESHQELQQLEGTCGELTRQIRSRREAMKSLGERRDSLKGLESVFLDHLPGPEDLRPLTASPATAEMVRSCAEEMGRLEQLKRRAGKLEEEIGDLKQQVELCRREAPEDADLAFLDDCRNILSSLLYRNLSTSVLFQHLQRLYREYGEIYTGANYRHKLYLQLLLCSLYYPHLRSPDTFVHIDEAQDISVAEFRLLRRVLGSRCVFNLYGDTSQTVYQYKGIRDWEDIRDITGGNVYRLNENYRNTMEITDFCNREFHTEVSAIGITGPQVLELSREEGIRQLLVYREDNPRDRLAILCRQGVKSIQDFLHQQLAGQDVSWYAFDPRRISVLSVEAAKGLEFDGVLTFIHQMSRNEIYISYTRAIIQLLVVREAFAAGLKEDRSDNCMDVAEEESALGE